MPRFLAILALLALPAGAGKAPKQCIAWAASWSDALDEAQACNVPIVVHRHGFYWSPCWSLHRSVLENKAYAAFAAQSTVEVLVTEEYDRALRDKNPLIRTYKAIDPYGDPVEYLHEFPGVTIEQLKSLSENQAILKFISPAGKIPFTAIVNPHTGDQMEGFVGVKTAKQFIAVVKKHVDALKKEHGPGVSRKVWNAVGETEVAVDVMLGDERIADALAALAKLDSSTARQPKSVRNRVEAIRETILEDAEKRLDVLAQKKNDSKARKEAMVLARALKGTPHGEKARAVADKLK